MGPVRLTMRYTTTSTFRSTVSTVRVRRLSRAWATRFDRAEHRVNRLKGDIRVLYGRKKFDSESSKLLNENVVMFMDSHLQHNHWT